MERRTFLSSLAFPILSAGRGSRMEFRLLQAGDRRTVLRSSRVVRRLQPVSLERRLALAALQEADPYILNTTLPELEEIELSNTVSMVGDGESLRAVAWNMERGRHWKEGVSLLQEHPALQNADILFLSEMDLGMARSFNLHTTRELASRLGMNYAFGVEFLELTNGEEQERSLYPGANEWGYHGNAILSRLPLANLRMIRFPGIEKWFAHYQKRLGGRMALLATIEWQGRPILLISTHLESGKDREMREHQMEAITAEIQSFAPDLPVLLGGDLNATPDEELFTHVRRAGILIEESNTMGTPTSQKLEQGKVVLYKNHIDYILTKDLEILRDETSPAVIPAAYPVGSDGRILGDHAIVTVRVRPA